MLADADVTYLLQRKGSCCTLFALTNALRYLGRPSPSPGSRAWEQLVDLAGCRDGSAVRVGAAAERLGLALAAVDPSEAVGHAPVMLNVWNPCRTGSSLHAALVVGGDAHRVRLVNYRWATGPVVEDLPWSEVGLPDPGNVNRRAWRIFVVA